MTGSLQSSPRSFRNEELVKRSTSGDCALYSSDGGYFLVFSGTKPDCPAEIKLDDVYAVFRSGIQLKVEFCPRVVSRRKWFFSRNEKKPKNPYERSCKTRSICLANDLEAAEWYDFIRKEITPSYTRSLTQGGATKKLLVLVNPIGGKRKGEEMFHEMLKPMLEGAGTQYELIVTNGPGHAAEVARGFSIDDFGAVAIVGGDGLFGEFLNGLNQRSDRLIALSIPLGVIPAGSSNCIACSVGLRQPLSACFAVVRGRMKPMDVLKVTLAGEDPNNPVPHVILSMCGVSYGFISEVNTHAARWRKVFGPARYTVCGVRTLFSSPMEYHVDCRFVEASEEMDPDFDKTECGPDCRVCERVSSARRASGVIEDPSCPSPPEVSYVKGGSRNQTHSLAQYETLTVPAAWKDGETALEARRKSLKPKEPNIDSSTLFLFSVTNLSIRQSQNWTVWNHNCHMASGYMDLVLIPVISRPRLLKFLSNYNQGGNKHKDDADVFSVIKARSVEMRITNVDSFPDWERGIKLAIDGETYPLQPLRIDTLHGFLNFICC
jgi:diacylglycerol kinase family enzyme